MSCDAIHKINHDPLDDKTHFSSSYPTESTGSTVLLSMHSPSASTSLIISWSSASVGFCPRDLITVPNSFVVIVPSPSLSNRENASLNSARGNHTFWCLWGLFTACKSGLMPKLMFSKTFPPVHVICKQNKGSKKKCTVSILCPSCDHFSHHSNLFWQWRNQAITFSSVSYNCNLHLLRFGHIRLAATLIVNIWNFYVTEWGDFLFFYFILLREKFQQFDWLRAVVFQPNLKYLQVKITNLCRY